MAVPNAYLTSTKNVKDILTAIQQAQAPKQFSMNFLANLGFKSSSDRLFIGVLKALGFLTPSGAPTPRYFEFLDQTQSSRVLADALREGYSDLFEINVKANEMPHGEVKNKLKTLTQGRYSDAVLTKMATTFAAFAAEADFKAVESAAAPPEDEPAPEQEPAAAGSVEERSPLSGASLRGFGGLVYNIQIQLPESRDPVVYDALFGSLKTHLFNE